MFVKRSYARPWLRRRGLNIERLQRIIEQGKTVTVAGQTVEIKQAQTLYSTVLKQSADGQFELRRSVRRREPASFIIYDRLIVRQSTDKQWRLVREMHGMAGAYWLSQQNLPNLPLLLLPVDLTIALTALMTLSMFFIQPMLSILFGMMAVMGFFVETIIHVGVLADAPTLPEKPGVFQRRLRVFRSRHALRRYLKYAERPRGQRQLMTKHGCSEGEFTI